MLILSESWWAKCMQDKTCFPEQAILFSFSSAWSVVPSATTGAAGPAILCIISQHDNLPRSLIINQALTPESAFSRPTAMMEWMMSQHSWTAMSISVASALLKACARKMLCQAMSTKTTVHRQHRSAVWDSCQHALKTQDLHELQQQQQQQKTSSLTTDDRGSR